MPSDSPWVDRSGYDPSWDLVQEFRNRPDSVPLRWRVAFEGIRIVLILGVLAALFIGLFAFWAFIAWAFGLLAQLGLHPF